MLLPTIAEYFSQFAKDGNIWPEPGLEVILKDGSSDFVSMLAPSYVYSEERLHGIDSRESACWRIDGTCDYYDLDIITVYEDGKLVARNEPAMVEGI